MAVCVFVSASASFFLMFLCVCVSMCAFPAFDVCFNMCWLIAVEEGGA